MAFISLVFWIIYQKVKPLWTLLLSFYDVARLPFRTFLEIGIFSDDNYQNSENLTRNVGYPL